MLPGKNQANEKIGQSKVASSVTGNKSVFRASLGEGPLCADNGRSGKNSDLTRPANQRQ
jgi:hypothetical protein